MAQLTTIDGIPLYSTVAEAIEYAAQNNLVGYHTHLYNGVVGYMGGATHGQASTASSGFQGDTTINNTNGNIGNY